MRNSVISGKITKAKKAGRRALSGQLTAYSVTAAAATLCASEAHATVTEITSTNLLFDYSPITLANQPTFHFTGLGFGAYVGFTIVGLNQRHSMQFSGFNSAPGSGFATIQGTFASVGGAAQKLSYGAAIGGAGRQFGYPNAVAGVYSSGYKGEFLLPGNTGYVGFKVVKGGATHYGWLKVGVGFDENGIPTSISLLTKPGTDVYGAYGLLSDNVAAGVVPEPSIAALSGLGLLALGTAGVREMRRRRAAAAA